MRSTAGAGSCAGRLARRHWRRLPRDYARKSDRDHDALERMVFFAQTGFCRWRVLLECFDEPLPFDHGCGRCDNCARLAAEPPQILPELGDVPVVAPPAQPPFNAGDAVKVPRYGAGLVASLSGDEISVRFPDGMVRTFMSSFVKGAKTARRARKPRTPPPIVVGALA